MRFGFFGTLDWNFGEFDNRPDLLAQIMGLIQQGGITDTAAGIQLILDDVLGSPGDR